MVAPAPRRIGAHVGSIQTGEFKEHQEIAIPCSTDCGVQDHDGEVQDRDGVVQDRDGVVHQPDNDGKICRI
jgi:hypothetical protein